jgi:hypothetical protein
MYLNLVGVLVETLGALLFVERSFISLDLTVGVIVVGITDGVESGSV